MTAVAVDYRMHRDSGIGVYLRQLIQRISAAHPERLHLTLLGGSAVTGTSRRPFSAPIFSIAEQLQYPFVVPRRTDVLWMPHYNVPLVSPGRLVVTIHDVCHLARPEYSHSRLKTAYARTMFETVSRRAARVICVSEFTAREVERLVGIDRSRITVVHSAVDPSWSAPSSSRRPHDRPFVLFVGNIKPHKNLRRLLAAFEALTPRIPHSLVLVGRFAGLGTPDREAVAAAERLGSRVVIAGEVPDDALRSYYEHADLLVFPSLYEGFGLPPLEAMASGLPAAVSNAASIPEVCGDGAVYFDPEDTDQMASVIERALTDESLRARLRTAGRKRVALYSWERAAETVATTLQEVGR